MTDQVNPENEGKAQKTPRSAGKKPAAPQVTPQVVPGSDVDSPVSVPTPGAPVPAAGPVVSGAPAVQNAQNVQGASGAPAPSFAPPSFAEAISSPAGAVGHAGSPTAAGPHASGPGVAGPGVGSPGSAGHGPGGQGSGPAEPAFASFTPTAQTAGAPQVQADAQQGYMTPEGMPATRKVRLAVARVSPWSIAKIAFLLSFALGIVAVVATMVLWGVVDSVGVFTNIQDFVNEVLGGTQEFDLLQYFEFSRVVALSALLSVINIVIMTALATIMAVLYNITSALVGGVHVTLTDD